MNTLGLTVWTLCLREMSVLTMLRMCVCSRLRYSLGYALYTVVEYITVLLFVVWTHWARVGRVRTLRTYR